MELTNIREIFHNREKYENTEVTIGGWVRSNRSQAQFGFLNVNDGSYFDAVQVVYDDKMEDFEKVSKFRVGMSVMVEGIVKLTPELKQPLEIHATKVVLLGDCPENYPIQPKRHTREFLREQAYLRPRTNLFQAVFRVRSVAAHAIHEFFQSNNYVYFHSPIITGADCEGSGQMFKITTLDMENLPLNDEKKVDYKKDLFGKPAYITGSGQLHGETYAMAFKNIYTFGPTFRAENSNTTRHAAEFWMIEPEIAFADLEDDMNLAESMLKYIINYVMENAPEEMNFFNSFVDKGLLDRLNNVANNDFARVTYTDAIDILAKNNDNFEFKVSWGCDLQTEHERYLTEQVFKRPVFVTDYPKDIKAFYMKINEDGKTVQGTDVLFPQIGEIIGGSVREESLDKLNNEIERREIPMKDMWWYLDTRRFGAAPHAGFGLGFERLLLFVTGMQNIRDVIPFPRTPKTAEF